ncbi:MAG: ABC transporter ATP-binding protein [Anaerolineae bacterium]
MASRPPAIVELAAITKVFDDDKPTSALGPLSLAVGAGEFAAVLGPSGSGKSTLLRLVADLERPSGGGITVCGHSPHEARRRREYGFVFQSPVLVEWRTVVGNAELPLEIAGYSPRQRRRRAEEVLALVGLRDFAGYRPWQLSGGMQQRAAIARALAAQPRLLLMDEPFGSLDEISRERLNLELLRIWRETQVTILFVTHDIEEAVFLADRVVLLTPRPGRIASEIVVDLPRPRVDAVRTSARFFDLVRRVRKALRGAADGHGP